MPAITLQPAHARDGFTQGLRLLTVAAFALAAVLIVLFTYRWRMAVDTPVMHYVVFLMRHGLVPYSDITDNNMPGTYLTEALGMAVFGGSDLAWRVYEFSLMAVFTGAACVATSRRDWVAGLFGSGVFWTLHSAEGPQLAAERELVIGVLLMASCALLFLAVRHHRPWLCALFGVASGLAASIKPTYCVVPFALLLLAAVHLRSQEKQSPKPYLLWSAGGLALVAVVLLLALLRLHALAKFWFVIATVSPAYTSLARQSLPRLFRMLMPSTLLVLTLCTVPLWAVRSTRGTWDWERWSLVLVAAFGLLSYLVQGKGSVYHRYIFLMFLLVLIGVAVFGALAVRGWPRLLAAGVLLATLGVAVPRHLEAAHQYVGQSSFELTLEQDLGTLGGAPRLQGEVQCFDMVYGCLDAMYHLGIVDQTGFTGDMLFFAPQSTAAVQFYRDRFWRLAARDQARVLVVSNGLYAEPNSYGKLDRWPAFAAYLAQRYELVRQRNFPHERWGYYASTPFDEAEADSYRLYVLRTDQELLRAAQQLQPGAVAVPLR